MKTRQGFVSNSSSSSFVLDVDVLTLAHRVMILHHAEFSRWLNEINPEFEPCGEGEEWQIICDEHKIAGYTRMDNFSMRDFLKEIGVPSVHWEKWG